MEVNRVQIFPETRKKFAVVKSVWQMKKVKISFSTGIKCKSIYSLIDFFFRKYIHLNKHKLIM